MQYIQEIKQILITARQQSYRAINLAMIEAYWKIGQKIVVQEQNGKEKANYGEAVLKELSKNLSAEFGKGFSSANLRNFRQFYLTYPDEQICYTLCSKLSWSHNRLIMRIDNLEARQYYLTEASQENWSVRTLERNIKTFYYNRLLSSKTILKNEVAETKINIKDFIKDPYVFEFLDIPEPKSHSEQEVESILIENFQVFLMELGKGFSFVGRQYRISSETEHYYIDLVFYNYLLKCFVLFDLKIGKLTHQDIGQMDMYRRMFDDLKKPEGDLPTIGIILCTEKSETVVKYSIVNDSPHLFATKYLPYLPSEKELIEEIEREKIKLKLLGH
ncbi:putative nuclease of restriction endonuclease-like (RecB) superfamily [Flavobacterium tiangeerense]|uniref:Nuclease of restriction endonuclease-like (RecB) superfamily n=1 Tax=Flavobacterium tiangeerense TaxID=459471 RepID=A0ABY3FLP2_9FLAO|nr:PDDEXK nuclease domain-containing protein [Flavobacterium tiangeerense]TWI01338.1 putative nuclease of restriction endonuclease-like (RecB) superfamily [Flavobacterium tiangeerense]